MYLGYMQIYNIILFYIYAFAHPQILVSEWVLEPTPLWILRQQYQDLATCIIFFIC